MSTPLILRQRDASPTATPINNRQTKYDSVQRNAIGTLPSSTFSSPSITSSSSSSLSLTPLSFSAINHSATNLSSPISPRTGITRVMTSRSHATGALRTYDRVPETDPAFLTGGALGVQPSSSSSLPSSPYVHSGVASMLTPSPSTGLTVSSILGSIVGSGSSIHSPGHGPTLLTSTSASFSIVDRVPMGATIARKEVEKKMDAIVVAKQEEKDRKREKRLAKNAATAMMTPVATGATTRVPSTSSTTTSRPSSSITSASATSSLSSSINSTLTSTNTSDTISRSNTDSERAAATEAYVVAQAIPLFTPSATNPSSSYLISSPSSSSISLVPFLPPPYRSSNLTNTNSSGELPPLFRPTSSTGEPLLLLGSADTLAHSQGFRSREGLDLLDFQSVQEKLLLLLVGSPLQDLFHQMITGLYQHVFEHFRTIDSLRAESVGLEGDKEKLREAARDIERELRLSYATNDSLQLSLTTSSSLAARRTVELLAAREHYYAQLLLIKEVVQQHGIHPGLLVDYMPEELSSDSANSSSKTQLAIVEKKRTVIREGYSRVTQLIEARLSSLILSFKSSTFTLIQSLSSRLDSLHSKVRGVDRGLARGRYRNRKQKTVYECLIKGELTAARIDEIQAQHRSSNIEQEKDEESAAVEKERESRREREAITAKNEALILERTSGLGAGGGSVDTVDGSLPSYRSGFGNDSIGGNSIGGNSSPHPSSSISSSSWHTLRLSRPLGYSLLSSLQARHAAQWDRLESQVRMGKVEMMDESEGADHLTLLLREQTRGEEIDHASRGGIQGTMLTARKEFNDGGGWGAQNRDDHVDPVPVEVASPIKRKVVSSLPIAGLGGGGGGGKLSGRRLRTSAILTHRSPSPSPSSHSQAPSPFPVLSPNPSLTALLAAVDAKTHRNAVTASAAVVARANIENSKIKSFDKGDESNRGNRSSRGKGAEEQERAIARFGHSDDRLDGGPSAVRDDDGSGSDHNGGGSRSHNHRVGTDRSTISSSPTTTSRTTSSTSRSGTTTAHTLAVGAPQGGRRRRRHATRGGGGTASSSAAASGEDGEDWEEDDGSSQQTSPNGTNGGGRYSNASSHRSNNTTASSGATGGNGTSHRATSTTILPASIHSRGSPSLSSSSSSSSSSASSAAVVEKRNRELADKIRQLEMDDEDEEDDDDNGGGDDDDDDGGFNTQSKGGGNGSRKSTRRPTSARQNGGGGGKNRSRGVSTKGSEREDDGADDDNNNDDASYRVDRLLTNHRHQGDNFDHDDPSSSLAPPSASPRLGSRSSSDHLHRSSSPSSPSSTSTNNVASRLDRAHSLLDSKLASLAKRKEEMRAMMDEWKMVQRKMKKNNNESSSASTTPPIASIVIPASAAVATTIRDHLNIYQKIVCRSVGMQVGTPFAYTIQPTQHQQQQHQQVVEQQSLHHHATAAASSSSPSVHPLVAQMRSLGVIMDPQTMDTYIHNQSILEKQLGNTNTTTAIGSVQNYSDNNIDNRPYLDGGADPALQCLTVRKIGGTPATARPASAKTMRNQVIAASAAAAGMSNPSSPTNAAAFSPTSAVSYPSPFSFPSSAPSSTIPLSSTLTLTAAERDMQFAAEIRRRREVEAAMPTSRVSSSNNNESSGNMSARSVVQRERRQEMERVLADLDVLKMHMAANGGGGEEQQQQQQQYQQQQHQYQQQQQQYHQQQQQQTYDTMTTTTMPSRFTSNNSRPTSSSSRPTSSTASSRPSTALPFVAPSITIPLSARGSSSSMMDASFSSSSSPSPSSSSNPSSSTLGAWEQHTIVTPRSHHHGINIDPGFDHPQSPFRPPSQHLVGRNGTVTVQPYPHVSTVTATTVMRPTSATRPVSAVSTMRPASATRPTSATGGPLRQMAPTQKTHEEINKRR